MIKILDLPLEQDLAPLYQYLREHGIPVRIVEASGRQEVWVLDERFREPILEFYRRYSADPQVRQSVRQWQAGEREFSSRPPSRFGLSDWLVSFWRAPVTWVGLIGILLVAGLMQFKQATPFLLKLLFADPFLSDYVGLDQRLALWLQTLAAGEVWRMLTPVFIHMGAMHLIFNSLWFWYLGMRIERHHGSGLLLALFLVSGVGSNLAQYLVSGPNFGGMSGVIYGYFGYLGWQTLRHPRSPVAIAPALLVFALVWLVLGYTGLQVMPGQGEIANTAHSGGLVLGILFAWGRELARGRRPE